MRVGLLQTPGEVHLWGLGVLGIVATFLSGLAVKKGAAIDYGDVGGKLWQSFIPFALAPFLLPFLHLLFASKHRASRISIVLLAPYFLVVVGVAVVRNSRDFFAQALAVSVISMVVVAVGGLVRPAAVHFRWFALLTLVGVPVIAALTYLGVSMAIARDVRGAVGPMDLARETLAVMQDPARVRAGRDKGVLISGGYNEVYIDNLFLNRLIQTKYIDNNLSETRFITAEDRIKAREQTVSLLLLNLPTPVLKALGIDLRKSDFEFSGGDFYSYLGSRGEMSGYKTGSSLADGRVIFGPLYWPYVFLFSLFVFLILDSFSSAHAGVLFVSPVLLMLFGRVFLGGLMGDSVASEWSLYIRTIPQAAAIYAVTRLVFLPASLSRV